MECCRECVQVTTIEDLASLCHLACVLGCILGTSPPQYHVLRIYRYTSWIFVKKDTQWLLLTGTGILLLFKSTQPGHNLTSGNVVHIGTAFWCISLSTTVIVTLLIVGRLVYIQRQTANILGKLPEYQDHYISAWTILLESSALYTAFGLVYLVLWVNLAWVLNVHNRQFHRYNQNSPVNDLFDFLLAQVVVSPLFCVLSPCFY